MVSCRSLPLSRPQRGRPNSGGNHKSSCARRVPHGIMGSGRARGVVLCVPTCTSPFCGSHARVAARAARIVWLGSSIVDGVMPKARARAGAPVRAARSPGAFGYLLQDGELGVSPPRPPGGQRGGGGGAAGSNGRAHGLHSHRPVATLKSVFARHTHRARFAQPWHGRGQVSNAFRQEQLQVVPGQSTDCVEQSFATEPVASHPGTSYQSRSSSSSSASRSSPRRSGASTRPTDAGLRSASVVERAIRRSRIPPSR